MAIALVDSDSTGFGITGAGFTYNFPAGAPGATDWDILCVNSDALVTTPSGGWALLTSQVNDQGSYLFARQGGAGTSVLVATPSGAGPFPANLAWARISGGNLVDASVSAQAAGLTNATPAVNTGVLASTGEAVFAYAALHNFVSAPTAPSWSSGYSGLEISNQGTGATACAGLLGLKLNAGTAAETPSVSWTNNVQDRYILVASFTPAAGAQSIAPDSMTVTVTLGAPTVALAQDIIPDSITLPVVLGPPTVFGPSAPAHDPVVELYTQLLSCLCVAVQSNPNPPLHCVPRIGTEVVYDLGQFSDVCCDGLAYIMLGDTYFSATSFPEQDIVQQIRGVCAPPTWAQVMRIGLVRCAPTHAPNTEDEPPTDDQWSAAAIQNLYDSQTLRKAACCFRNWIHRQVGNEYDGMDVAIGRQIQVNPQGGCVERYVDLTVQFPDTDCACG
jgi:hypothetical protein